MTEQKNKLTTIKKKIQLTAIITISTILIIGVGLYLFKTFTSSSKPKIKKNKYYKYKVEAKKLHESGEKLKEIESYKKCIKENKENPDAYFDLIRAYIDINDFQNAKKQLEDVKKIYSSINERNIYDSLTKELNENEDRVKKYKNLNIVKDFMYSLYKNGAKIKKSKIDYNKRNTKGLIATEKIKKDEIIAEIPLNMLITDKQASDFLEEKYSKETNLSRNEINKLFKKCIAGSKFKIVLFILENYEKETYKEYFSTLDSTNISHFAYFMDDRTKEEFKDTDIPELLNLKNEIIDHDINILYNNIKPTKKFDYNTLKKYYIIVSSKVFTAKINNIDTSIMSPYIDMANNYSHKKNTHWTFDDKKNSFILQASKNINKSSEIIFTYGDKSNKYLYIIYGFTEKNNRINEINLSYNNNSYRCINELNDKKNKLKNLLSDIEYNITNNNDKNLTKKQKTKVIQKEKLEIKKFEILKSLCYDRLSKYKTTLKDDKNNINKNISISKYNCLNILIDEKTMLNQLIQFSNECISYFKRYKIKDIEINKKQLNNMSKLTIDYLNTLIY